MQDIKLAREPGVRRLPKKVLCWGEEGAFTGVEWSSFVRWREDHIGGPSFIRVTQSPELSENHSQVRVTHIRGVYHMLYTNNSFT